MVLGRLGTVLKNPGFTSLLLTFSLISTASLSFVAASSYIYQDGFGLSEQGFSYFFALNAFGLIAGPLVYLRLSRSFNRTGIITACFAGLALSGGLVCWLGNLGPWAFALSLLPASILGRGPAGRGPPDAGAAEGGYRLGLGADPLLWAAAQESG